MTRSLRSFDRLISHRFRGFAPLENTVEGLNTALTFGVQHLEFDIRVARCGTPMIYHDEYALDGHGKRRLLCDVMAKDFAAIGGRFVTIPTAEDLFNAARDHEVTSAQLLVDIKDAGFELEIHALVMAAGLSKRVTYVSWVPEALYQIHAIAPNIPLCLSHWCEDPNAMIRAHHVVYTAADGHISKTAQSRIHGQRSGYYVKGGLRGTLRDMIMKTGGSVCVPQDMVSTDLVADYHRDGIAVSTFSYINWPSIEAHDEAMNIDLYFIDDKVVFDAL
ncbi:glycerophosphodiester phosphodiesterase [Fretibacter rubidus]|uniref:glycerophosphodiester phosphodiesterase n=1 Tax=Fretibacter rubidus TaxID=570162 RepID=UPI00352BB8A9